MTPRGRRVGCRRCKIATVHHMGPCQCSSGTFRKAQDVFIPITPIV